MTDFFAGLIDRSLDQGRILQRRRPSRFEVAAGAREAVPELTDIRDDGQGSRQREESSRSGRFDPPPGLGLPPRGSEGGPGENAVSPRQANVSVAQESTPLPAASGAGNDRIDAELARLAEAVVHIGRQDRPPAAPQAREATAGRQTIVTQTVVQTQGPKAKVESGRDEAPSEAKPILPSRTEDVVVRPRILTQTVIQTQGPKAKVESARDEAPSEAKPLLPSRSEEVVVRPRPLPVAQAPSAGPKVPVTPAVKAAAQPAWLVTPASRERAGATETVPTPKPALPPMPLPIPRPAPIMTHSRRASAAAAAPAPATVHVSIGRIEIRATPAPAKSPRNASPAAPRLGLDDYLKARNGGNR
jgi:hypothetical protein